MIAVIAKNGLRLALTNSPKAARKVVSENAGSHMEIVNEY